MDLGLRGRAALVTGGSAGIGRQIALCLAGEGADVAICARDPGRVAATLAELRALGAGAHGIVADLYEPDAPRRVIDEAAAAFGRLDILVNNVSTDSAMAGSFDDAADRQITERVTGKAFTAIRCAKAALPHMRRGGWGRIVSIGGASSHSVSRPPASSGTNVVQGLGNALVSNFSKHLSLEVARDNITVNVVHPHLTKTERYERRVRRAMAERGLDREAAERALAEDLPMGRAVEAVDIAWMVAYLASERARSVTGQAIGVDGGAGGHIPY